MSLTQIVVAGLMYFEKMPLRKIRKNELFWVRQSVSAYTSHGHTRTGSSIPLFISSSCRFSRSSSVHFQRLHRKSTCSWWSAAAQQEVMPSKVRKRTFCDAHAYFLHIGRVREFSASFLLRIHVNEEQIDVRIRFYGLEEIRGVRGGGLAAFLPDENDSNFW